MIGGPPGRRAPLLVVACLVVAAGGCAGPPPKPTAPLPGGSCTLALPDGTSPEQAIHALVEAEARYLVSQEIEPLMALWAENAQVVDMKHTPENASDDQAWLGQDAIRYRYLRSIFPSAPGIAAPADLEIQVEGDQAVITATTGIGEERSPGGDRWEATRNGACWLLQRLEYNREPAP